MPLIPSPPVDPIAIFHELLFSSDSCFNFFCIDKSTINEALLQQLNHNFEEISEQYAEYVMYIRDSVIEKEVTVRSLVNYLLFLPGFKYRNDKDEHKLLHGKRAQLKQAETVEDVFLLLYEECASFLNYNIFLSIAKKFGGNKCDHLKYPEYLKAFVEKHTISELVKVIPNLEKKCDSSKQKVTCKFNIELTERVAEVSNLKIRIADILGLNVQSLELVDVNDGCVVVTFLVPAHIAGPIFTAFTGQQVEEFKAAKIIWLKYEDRCLLDFSDGKEENHTSASGIANIYI